ncbi:MAG TPA: ice-binding family protein [Anaerovoracaceae bacterium]|nr:ice-binding family protein [Anaerovoracaceae bacterium]
MKTLKKKRVMTLLLTLALILVMSIPTTIWAAGSPTKVELLTTETFAILANTTITNTGPTKIDGDAGNNVGLYSGTDIPGLAQITMTGGTVYTGGAVSLASVAKTDLTAAYLDAESRTSTSAIDARDGGLDGLILTTGVYNSASTMDLGVNKVLTLDAQGDPEAVFIFQVGSDLTTGTGSKIELTGGAVYCRVFWQVGSSATLGVNSTFVGHIFALTTITANTGAKIQGQLLARNGAVNLDSNTITNGFCDAAAPPPPSNNHSHYFQMPLINVTKIPSPLALVSGSGLVTYTYKVTNPGDSTLSNVHVTDDKISTVSYVSGDINLDDLLQTDETWTYTSQAMVEETTTNTATARGYYLGVPATDTAIATVTVTDIIPPLINVIKRPSPLALDFGKGLVTYTYRVTNPGTIPLSNVRLTDDKIDIVKYVSGDVNSDTLLQPSEAWIYTAQVTLYQTTTNIATAKGDANNITAIDTSQATVVVVPTTITGGELPVTSTPWYNIFFAGFALILAGVMVLGIRRHYE